VTIIAISMAELSLTLVWPVIGVPAYLRVVALGGGGRTAPIPQGRNDYLKPRRSYSPCES